MGLHRNDGKENGNYYNNGLYGGLYTISLCSELSGHFSGNCIHACEEGEQFVKAKTVNARDVVGLAARLLRSWDPTSKLLNLETLSHDPQTKEALGATPVNGFQTSFYNSYDHSKPYAM